MWEILTGEEPYANMHCGAIIGNYRCTLTSDTTIVFFVRKTSLLVKLLLHQLNQASNLVNLTSYGQSSKSYKIGTVDKCPFLDLFFSCKIVSDYAYCQPNVEIRTPQTKGFYFLVTKWFKNLNAVLWNCRRNFERQASTNNSWKLQCRMEKPNGGMLGIWPRSTTIV